MNLALIVGFASLYLWFLLAKASITEPVFSKARDHEGWIGELVNCGWCAGFWLTGTILLVTGNYDPLTHLAAASVVGLMASLTA
jgi:hypothetical protein